MERKDEIIELLKHLLGKADKAIDKSQYCEDANRIIKSANGVLEISKTIEKYINELNALTLEDSHN